MRRHSSWFMAIAWLLSATAAAQDFLTSGSTNAWLGFSVAIDGDRAAIGAPGQLAFPPGGPSGQVSIYERQGGQWQETRRLTGAQEGANFGWSVALQGDDLIVGVPGAAGGPAPGEVQTFRFDGSDWSAGPTLSSGTLDWDRFGESVALDGGQLLVGAPRDDLAAVDGGAVYCYSASGADWVLDQVLTSPDGIEADFYGFSVAVRDGEALVGAIADDEGNANAGSVWAYELAQAGWVVVDWLLPIAPGLNGSFGRDVDLRGGLALVGSVNEQAQLYERLPGAWNLVGVLTPPSGPPSAFGYSVALDDAGRAVVGAPAFGDSVVNEGAVYAFYGEEWTDRWRSVEQPGDKSFFGGSLASDGARIVVGAHLTTTAVLRDGAAWSYEEGELAPQLFEAFCPCGPGPCGNGALETGCVNSTGAGATLAARGSSSLERDDLVLSIQGVPGGQLGMVLMGDGLADIPVGDGRLCVTTGPVGFFRFPAVPTGIGGFDFGPGLAGFSDTSFGLGVLTPGQTWFFQAWFRDGPGPCGGALNLTNALAITFTL